MKIAFCTTYFYPDRVGGGETHTYHLAKALTAQGHSVEIWRTSPPTGDMVDRYEHDGLTVLVAPEDPRSLTMQPAPGARGWVEERVRDEAPDVVHLMISGRCRGVIEAVLGASIPLVVTLLDFSHWCPRTLIREDGSLCAGPVSIGSCHDCLLGSQPRLRIAAKVWRQLPRGAHSILARSGPSQFRLLQEQYVSLESRLGHFWKELAPTATFIAPSPIMQRLAAENGVAAERIHLMPYGVPESFVGTGRPKSRSEVLRVGYFGRIVREKGVHVLVDAVRSLPDSIPIDLQIFGYVAPESDEYARSVAAAVAGDRRIRFRGVIGQQEMPAAHRDLDLVAIPSLWHENATIVMLESQALGTPVISSDVAGVAPFIEDGVTGFLVAPGDVAALSKRLASCAGRLAELREMAQRCRPLLTTQEQAALVTDIYQGVTNCRERDAEEALPLGRSLHGRRQFYGPAVPGRRS